MAQPPRMDFEGAFHHVVARGNGRARIYLSDRDYIVFLITFARVVEAYEWRCHAFCLMPNHYHLLLQTTQPNLSRGMQVLNNLYARQFNRRHGRQDHVFRARFRSVVVKRDSHVLESARYIVLNTVRAGLCERPEQWPYSSYASTAGLGSPLAFLTTAWLLGQFGSNHERACERYRAFIAEGLRPAGLLAAAAADVDVVAP